jgi:hypothetical protein
MCPASEARVDALPLATFLRQVALRRTARDPQGRIDEQSKFATLGIFALALHVARLAEAKVKFGWQTVPTEIKAI